MIPIDYKSLPIYIDFDDGQRVKIDGIKEFEGALDVDEEELSYKVSLHSISWEVSCSFCLDDVNDIINKMITPQGMDFLKYLDNCIKAYFEKLENYEEAENETY